MTVSHRTQLDTSLSPPVGDEHEGAECDNVDDHNDHGHDAHVVHEARCRGRGRRRATDHVRSIGYGSGERTESVASGLWFPITASFPFSTYA